MAAKNDVEERLSKCSSKLQRSLVNLDTFEASAKKYQSFVHEGTDFSVKKQMLQKFIQKVEVGVETVKIHWNLDQNYYERELAFSGQPGGTVGHFGGSVKKFGCFGLHSLTNGAQDWTCPTSRLRLQLRRCVGSPRLLSRASCPAAPPLALPLGRSRRGSLRSRSSPGLKQKSLF